MFEKLHQEVKEGAANWDVMTNRYFDTVEQQDILNRADEFLSQVYIPTGVQRHFRRRRMRHGYPQVGEGLKIKKLGDKIYLFVSREN